jgi:DNA-binding response OmpR family regulator
MRVLIVEDEILIALDLEMRVEQLGHEVAATAVSKEEAIKAARRTLPDLVLMDLRLVGPSSGKEAALAIRRELDIPSIILSGNVHEITAIETAEMQPFASLAKPLVGEQLEETIRAFAAAYTEDK